MVILTDLNLTELRSRIRRLERALTLATSSAEREPFEAELIRCRNELRLRIQRIREDRLARAGGV